MRRQAALLGVNRSSLYYKSIKEPGKDDVLKARIEDIYKHRPAHGSRKIAAILSTDECPVNRKRVQRLMRMLGIRGISPGPNLSRRNLQHAIHSYKLKGIKPQYPNHIWGIDITYIRLAPKGWMYLVAVVDWFSRCVIAWEMDQSLRMPFVMSAVNKALSKATPKYFNSDQGSHFTCSQYIDVLKEHNVEISMDSKGRAIDNIFTERFWRSVKYEEVFLNEYRSPRECRKSIASYINYYVHERPHMSLRNKTPAEVYCDIGGASPRTPEFIALDSPEGTNGTARVG